MKEMLELGFAVDGVTFTHEALGMHIKRDGNQWTNLRSGRIYKGSKGAFIHYIKRMMKYLRHRHANNKITLRNSLPPASNRLPVGSSVCSLGTDQGQV